MEENEKIDSDFSNDKIHISEEFWNYMENYWHNNREFPESTESSLSKKADLVDGKVPSSQLPSYVDDVLEFDSFGNLPNPGEKGKIYLVTNDNSQFRWSGSEYIQLNSDEFLMTTNTVQNITGQKNFLTNVPITFKNTDKKSWVIHKPLDNSLIFSPSKSKDSEDWDWSNQIRYREDGAIEANSFVKAGSNDDYFLTGGGGHTNKNTKEDSYIHSSRNFTEGTLIKTTVDYSVEYGHQFLLEMKGNMYTENLPLEMKMQGYIYYGTIICTRGYSTYSDLKKITAMNLDGKLCFWFPRLGYWQGFSVKLTIGYGGQDNGINRVTAVEDSPDPQGSKRVEIKIDTLSTQEWSNENLWKKYDSSTFKGINDNDTRNFSFLQNDGNVAKKINTGGILVSDAYSDETYIPSNGIYSNGDIISNSNIKAKYFNGNGFSSNQLNGSQVFHNGFDTLYIGNSGGLQYINFETGGYDLKHYRTDLGYGKIWDAHNFNPDLKVNKSGDTMTGGLIVNSPDSIGSNNLGALPQNTKLFLANGNTLVANYGTVFWTEGTGDGYIQQQRADGAAIAYRLNLQPYGGQLFYGNNEVATVNQFQNYYTKNESLNLFVGLNGVQTIYDTKTFNSSPVIPNGTLGNHAVNLDQLNARINGDYLISQIINDANNADNEHGVVFNYGTGANLPAGIGEAVLMTTSFLPNYFSNQFATDFFTGEHFLRTQQFGVWGDYYKFWSTKHFSANDITNWNISFGWGNHATAGYATTSQLFKNLQYTSDLNLVSESGIYRQENPTSGFSYTTTLNLNSFDGRQQLTIERSGGGMKFRGTNTGSGNTNWSDWKDVIHSSNFSDYLNNSSQLNSKVTNLENVTGIGFSSGNADLPPYFYHPVNGYRFLATQSWVSSNYISTSHIANTITLTNIQQWNDAYSYGIRVNNVFSVNSGQSLIIIDDYNGGDAGLYDESYNKIVAGKDNPEFLKYGSTYGEWNGINFNMASDLVSIGKPNSNAVDKVQIAGDISVDALYYDNNDANLILNPLYDESGDVRDSRNAHVYIVTGNNVRLPIKPILGQRIEVFNNSDSTIGIEHDNVGTLFYLSAFKRITGIVYRRGFVFDEEAVVAKNYEI